MLRIAIAVEAKLRKSFAPCSLLPAPCSLLPAPCSLLPAPCSLLPAPCSLCYRV
ncbi:MULTISPECIES: hypothetical protein [unclassified Moorena]|uniref:hypothetical protein n=1 Tax=unclassified Moorena TaxID=2683338 RepID=UPI0013C20B1E|nr:MULTISPECIES: hypothetical protein [unclassified Moorena]NEO05495.1 hypothetical protein [Moorena sp. SIO3I8]NEP22098.1 hypothetical protein [Moorena sp. SIO3I6]